MKYLPYVHLTQGTQSCLRFSHGNCLPLTQLPFSMAGFTLQTDTENTPWFFSPDSRGLEGIRLTHQPSPWIRDYGALLWLPQTDVPKTALRERWSDYAPEKTVLQPDYMRVTLLRSMTTMELTPTMRGCSCQVTYPENRPAYMSFFSVLGNTSFQWDEQRACLVGTTDGHSDDDTKGFCMHVIVRFPQGAVDAKNTLISEDGLHSVQGIAVSGEQAAIHLALTSRQVGMHISISYISLQQAEENLRQDTLPGDFSALHVQATNIWENYLSRVQVETSTEEEMHTFYSCLYRCFLFPHAAYETDAQGQDIHFVPSTGSVAFGRRYTDTGFWDTYRTQFPLLSFLAPDVYRDMMEAFVREYVECGWLPRWPSIGEVGCMPSTLIDGVIADGAVKELLSESTLRLALQGMLHHANTRASDNRYGRTGVTEYLQYGYVPSEVEGHTVNLTLDAAYGDFCIAQVAKVLGETWIEQEYRQRAKRYVNLFDAKTGFMRAKDKAGEFSESFDPFEWGGPYCEANAWQTTFSVQHDIAGLATLYGGKQAMLQKLEELFAAEPKYRIGSYGMTIHEMAEAVAINLGQCAMNNQPSFHIPFLFAALGDADKTAYWVEKICKELFSATPSGYPGDEDNGSMAAWYIFSMLGFYPICPGKPAYIRSKMLVKTAKIWGHEWNSADHAEWIPHNAILP